MGYKVHKNKIMNCEFCNNEFYFKFRTKNQPIKFCSRECYYNSKSKKYHCEKQICKECNVKKFKYEFDQINKNRKNFRKICKVCRKNRWNYLKSDFKNKNGISYETYKKGKSKENFLRICLANAKTRAKNKQIDYNISIEFLLELLSKQNNKCNISQQKLTFIIGQGIINTNVSIDRIDSNKGYAKDNIQLICYIVNIMKNNMTMKEFIQWCNFCKGKNNEY